MRWISNLDLDDVLAYRTSKVVVIKDRWLGVMRLFLLTSTFAYFIFGQLWANRRYLDLKPVTAVIDPRLKEPKNKTSLEDLPYCSQHAKKLPHQLHCQVQPYEYILHGSQDTQVFVTTSIYWKQWTCLDGARSAVELEACETFTPKEFVANAEAYSITLLHSTEKINSSSMNGYLMRTDGTRQPVTRGSARGGAIVYDILPVKDLLEVLGIHSLDNTGDTYDKDNHLRRNGMILTLLIHYEHDWRGRTYEYSYRVKRHETNWASHFTIVGARRKNETLPGVVKRSGLQIELRYAGKEGDFKFEPFLLAIVSSFALVKISNFVVDKVCVHVMPMRGLYSLAKFEETVNFSDYKTGDHHAVDGVKHLLDHCGSLCGKTLVIAGMRVQSSTRIGIPSKCVANQSSRIETPSECSANQSIRIETPPESIANQSKALVDRRESLEEVVQEASTDLVYTEHDVRKSLAPTSKDDFSALKPKIASFCYEAKGLGSYVSKDEFSALRSEINSLSGMVRDMQDELSQYKADVAQLAQQWDRKSTVLMDNCVGAMEAEQKRGEESKERFAHLEAEIRLEREERVRTEDLARSLKEAHQRVSNVSLQTEQTRDARLLERTIALESHQQKLRSSAQEELNLGAASSTPQFDQAAFQNAVKKEAGEAVQAMLRAQQTVLPAACLTRKSDVSARSINSESVFYAHSARVLSRV